MRGGIRPAGFNLRRIDATGVGIALDETVTRDDLARLAAVLGAELGRRRRRSIPAGAGRAPRRSWSTRSSTAITPSTRCCAT